MKPFRKILGIPFPLAVAIALCVSYALIFGKPTYIVWTMKKEAASNPRLSLIPVPLSDTSISQGQGTSEKFFGYQFEVPWQEGEQKQRDSIAFVFSESGQEGVSFFDPRGDRGFIRMMKETPGLRVEYLNPLYGRENVQSDYEFVRAALNTTPSQLSLFMPWSKEVYAANLLRMKEVFLLVPQGGLYSFEFGQLRGFQHGDPVRDKNVEVEAYGTDDRKVKINLSSKSGPNGGMTQPDINRVLQTLRPESSALPERPASSSRK
jgi:hypothetical protein